MLELVNVASVSKQPQRTIVVHSVQERMKRSSTLKSFKRSEIFQRRAYRATCGDYGGIHALRLPLMFAVLLSICVLLILCFFMCMRET